jgi:hypothetical protein
MSFKRIMPNKSNFGYLETREISDIKINTQPLGKSYIKAEQNFINT